MPRAIKSFPSVVTSLWFRLISVAILALVFAEALLLASGKAQGWTYYLTGPEVAFEVIVRLVAVALAGVVLGTLCTAAAAPFLSYSKTSRERLADGVTKVVVVVVLFLDAWFALRTLILWSHLSGRFVTFLVAGYFLAFAVSLLIPRGRTELTTSLDGFLGEKATRRTAIATGFSTAALVATEFALGRTSPAVVKAAPVSPRPKPNILLITFDALSAEDMSLYGYRLPTTPNIDAFARRSTTFTNFFSASTFTTPSVATILTGLPPSETHVYQLEGRLDDAHARKSLPHLMRATGYATGASISSPYAYYFAKGLANDYDSLPPSIYRNGLIKDSWDVTGPLHQQSQFGSRIEEFLDLEAVWDYVPERLERLSPRRFGRLQPWFPPAMSFNQAHEVLGKLPDGFFLWVHVMAPHWPFLPDLPDQRRFLDSDEMRTPEEQEHFPFWPHYGPAQQSRVDKIRLRHDELLASADRAFGAFIADLESAGTLRNTAVIVSADHGESFEGGIYDHENPYQTRPEIHIPLIIRIPGQMKEQRVAVTADQTAIAPTILDLAGQPKPAWMPGQSLVGWLKGDGEGEDEGLAFTEHFDTDSVFAPVHNGTVGVIDGRYQYLLDLATGKGTLRPLREAQIWNLDRSAENPEAAARLRAAIYARFPDLPRKTG